MNEATEGRLSMSQTKFRAPGFIQPASRQGSASAKMKSVASAGSIGPRATSSSSSMRRSASVQEVAPERLAWQQGAEAAEKYHGLEITKWAAPVRDYMQSTTRTDFVHAGAAAIPAKLVLQPNPYVAEDGRKRDYRSSYSIDYPSYPVQPKQALCQQQTPDEGRGSNFGAARTTTQKHTYPYPPMNPKHVPWQTTQKKAHVTKAISGYASTYDTSYVPHGYAAAPSMKPPYMEAMSTKVKIGKSTYQTEYLTQPLNPKVTPWQTLDRKFKPAGAIGTTGSSTHKADFIRYEPRAGLKVALGVQISSKPYKQGGVGGQFHVMIPAGSAAPAAEQQQFTTVVDGQRAAQIVVVARGGGAENGVELCHFELPSIKESQVGVPRVTVTFKLIKEQLLKVSATYEQGHQTRQLVIRDKKSLRTLNVVG